MAGSHWIYFSWLLLFEILVQGVALYQFYKYNVFKETNFWIKMAGISD